MNNQLLFWKEKDKKKKLIERKKENPFSKSHYHFFENETI